jgi:hypothetical protein
MRGPSLWSAILWLLVGCEAKKPVHLSTRKGIADPGSPARVADALHQPVDARPPSAKEHSPAASAQPETQPAAVATVALPAAPFEKVLPSNSPLTDKADRRIRFRLRDRVKAPIVLRDVIQVDWDDGSMDVFSLYEYSQYEECVRGYSTRKEGRDQCLSRELDYERQRLNADCVGLGAVHAAFAPPKPGTPVESGGALTVWSMPLDTGLCVAEEVSTFAADIDGDDKLEMVIDITSARTNEVLRGSYEHQYRRTFYVFPGDDNPDGARQLLLGNWLEGPTGAGRVPEEELVEFRDVDGDSRLDLIQTALFDAENCDADKGWREPAEGASDPCVWEHRGKTIFRYDAANDRYVAAPGTASAASDGPAPQP